jgi:hypothetical protein
LRSLEEFRKNPHVKIPPKSPSTNFQGLGKFKNPILNRKFFFLAFGLANLAARSAYGPASPPAAPSRRPKSSRPAHPARASVTSSQEICFPFWFAPSRAGRLSLVSLASGPCLSAMSSPPRQPTPDGFSRRLRPPRVARPLTSRCPARYLPHSLIPLLNRTPSPLIKSARLQWH